MSQPSASSHDLPPRRGFFVNVGSMVFARGFLALSQVLILPVVARHLTVDEFALMALAMTVVIFASVLSDAGLGRSLIRSSGNDQLEWSSVFWLLVAVGVGLCAVVLVIAPLWAWYFGLPELWAVLSALSVVPLMQAVAAAPNAEIERREHYTAIARLQMIAAGVGLVAAVLLAIAGAGVWALVIQQLLLAGIRLVGTLYLSEFRPMFAFSWRMLEGHLRFARDAISTSVIAAVQNQVGTVAVGKLLGQVPLGIFAMSQRFTRLPQFGLAGPMSAVVYVRMAKAQDSPEKLVRIYLASCRLLAAVLVPALGMIAVSGREVFAVLFTDDWTDVAPVFALSIPGIVLEAVTITCLVCIFRALGRTELQVRLMIEGTLIKVPLVIGGALISVEAAAAAYTAWALIYVPRGLLLARRIVPLHLRDCVGGLIWPVLVTAVGGMVYWMIVPSELGDPAFGVALAVAITCAAYAVIYVIDRAQLRAAAHLLK